MFSKYSAYLTFKPYVSTLVFALTSRNKGKSFILRQPPYPAETADRHRKTAAMVLPIIGGIHSLISVPDFE